MITGLTVKCERGIGFFRQLHQSRGLLCQGCHAGIALGNLVPYRFNGREHLRQTLFVVLVNFSNPGNLLLNPVRLVPDLLQALAHALHRSQPRLNTAGKVFNPGHNQRGIRTNFLEGFRHFTGRLGRAARQLTHLIRHHGKSATLITRTGGLNGRIECKQIGLLGNTLNGGGHALDLVGFLVQLLDQPEILTGLLVYRAHTIDGRDQRFAPLGTDLLILESHGGGIGRLLGGFPHGLGNLARVIGHLGGFFNLTVQPDLELVCGKGDLGGGNSVPVSASGEGFHQSPPGFRIGKQLPAMGPERMIFCQGALIQSPETAFGRLQHPDDQKAGGGCKANHQSNQY